MSQKLCARLALPAALLGCLLLAACGGGGGGARSAAPDPTDMPGVDTPSNDPAPGEPPSATSIDPLSGILTLPTPLALSWNTLNGVPVRTPAGTQSYAATLDVDGQTRRYIVIRPDPLPASAPMLLLLHPLNTSPEITANFTFVADFAATQGFWAVLPAAADGTWKGEATESDSDKRFLTALIETMVAQGVDAERISLSGYSSGGVMTQRMACEAPELFAAFGIVAATMPYSLWTSCAPSPQRPKLYVLGTDDPLAPYNGVSGLGSAAALMAFWAQQQGCTGALSTPVPDLVDDGTTAQRDQRTGCANGTTLQLYTVQNGGHAWPGGLTQSAGLTSFDISATGLIWSLASAHTR